MKSWMSKFAAGIAAAGLSVAMVGMVAPEAQAAQAVSGSTSWGSFSCTNVHVSGGQGLTKLGRFSGSCIVTDKAADGHGVYIQYQGVRNKAWDTAWTRATLNASGKGRSHRESKSISIRGVDSWRLRVCKQVANATDPCSSYDVAS